MLAEQLDRAIGFDPTDMEAVAGLTIGTTPGWALEVSNNHRRAQHERDADGDYHEKEFAHRNC